MILPNLHVGVPRLAQVSLVSRLAQVSLVPRLAQVSLVPRLAQVSLVSRLLQNANMCMRGEPSFFSHETMM